MGGWSSWRSRDCAACSTSGRSSLRSWLACLLIAFADGALPRFAAWVYAMALAAMFGASALYHRYPFKSAARRVWARRLDHSTIFLFIAGTYTPFALLAFNGTISWIVLATVWFGAALGLVLNFFWLHAPRWVASSRTSRSAGSA